MSRWHNLSVTQDFCEIIAEQIMMLRVKRKEVKKSTVSLLQMTKYIVCSVPSSLCHDE